MTTRPYPPKIPVYYHLLQCVYTGHYNDHNDDQTTVNLKCITFPDGNMYGILYDGNVDKLCDYAREDTYNYCQRMGIYSTNIPQLRTNDLKVLRSSKLIESGWSCDMAQVGMESYAMTFNDVVTVSVCNKISGINKRVALKDLCEWNEFDYDNIMQQMVDATKLYYHVE